MWYVFANPGSTWLRQREKTLRENIVRSLDRLPQRKWIVSFVTVLLLGKQDLFMIY